MPQILTDDEVLRRVRLLVGGGGRIIWTHHAEERLAQRGYGKSQVKECLLKGTFMETPHQPNRFGTIEYKFRMHATISGEPIEVVASLNPNSNSVIIISAFD